MMDREEIQAWKQNPMTAKVLGHLRERQQEVERLVSLGGTVFFDSVDRTALQTAKQSGYCQGLEYVLNLGKD